jgi:hypothetical protein
VPPGQHADALRIGNPTRQRHAEPDARALAVRQPVGHCDQQRLANALPVSECDQLAVAQRDCEGVGLALT